MPVNCLGARGNFGAAQRHRRLRLVGARQGYWVSFAASGALARGGVGRLAFCLEYQLTAGGTVGARAWAGGAPTRAAMVGDQAAPKYWLAGTAAADPRLLVGGRCVLHTALRRVAPKSGVTALPLELGTLA